jgi:hypothetical protein
MPRVQNVHERTLPHSPTDVGALLGSLASAEDRLWPAWRWPAQRLDGPLAVGARGGHGPIRYTVVEYEPGARVVYEFTAPRGLIGTHGIEIVERDSRRTVMRHTLVGRTAGSMRLAWPLVWRPMHDALIDDALDTAAASLAGEPIDERRLTRRVLVLRALARRLLAAQSLTAQRPLAGDRR